MKSEEIELLAKNANEVGFELIFDSGDNEGALKGHARDFIGTFPELKAFLFGWVGAKSLTHEENRDKAKKGRIVRSFLSITTVPLQYRDGCIMVAIRPWAPFKVERIAIPDDLTVGFDVTDLRVGNRSQFRHPAPVPASFFATRIANQALFTALPKGNGSPIQVEMTEHSLAEFGRVVEFETCQVAMDLVLACQLQGEEFSGRHLSMIFMGKSLDYYGNE